MDNYQGWIALLTTATVFLALQLRRGAPIDLLFLGGLVVVTITGVITPEQALSGFSSTAVLTIGALLVVAAALRKTGVLDWIGHHWLGRVHTERSALLSLAAGLVSISAFLLNTALVAMAMPVVLDWCRKRSIAPSRMLIPVSYFAILGGVCTMIGTSTTLVVNDGLRSEYSRRNAAIDAGKTLPAKSAKRRWGEAEFAEMVRPMDLFEIGWVGLPCALVGSGVLILLGRRLLPSRSDMIEQFDEQRREYLVEMLVQPECRMIGQTVESAGLRHLPGLFLIEIDREYDVVTPVAPTDTIHAGDRLIFTGVVSTILDLEKIPGLVPAADTNYEFRPEMRPYRHLTEVVLSRTSPLIGTTVREANFRQRYNAAVIAVHRNGVRLTNKIGNIRLEPGDTLLLQTRHQFVSTYRNSRDFYLVSSVEGDDPRRHDRARLAGFLALSLVIWLALTGYLGLDFVSTDWAHPSLAAAWRGVCSPAVVALGVAVLMIVTRCLRVSDARASIDYQILFIIVGALGLGKALLHSGAAEDIAQGLVWLVGPDRPLLLLVTVYLITIIFTEMITNNAVAAMLFPLAVAVAWQGDCNPRPFVMAVALAASLSFVTPVGYQTNLMVMGPGGYRPPDYFRVGLPIALVVTVTALCLIPRVWPL